MNRESRRLVVASLAALALISGCAKSSTQDELVAPALVAADKRVRQTPPRKPVHIDRVEHEGIAVELAIRHTDPDRAESADSGLHEGDVVTVQFKITDTTTGTPLTTLEPAGWIHPRQTAATTESKVKAFLTGSLSSRAEVDLNVFYTLALNENATISVVDPLFGYGGSKLLEMVRLESPGQDWILNDDQSRLFVSLSDVNKVAVVDTSNWKVVANIDTGEQPMRLGIQPDGKYLWVACDGAETGSLTVIDGETLQVARQIPIRAGHHEIAFTADIRYAFVTNQTADVLSVVDIRELAVVKELPTGVGTTWVAYGELGQAVYAVNAVAGTIQVIDARRAKPVRTIRAEPGVRSVHFTPSGRYAIAVNPMESLLHVIDTSTHRIVQSGEVGKVPDQITFTENLAYVRSLESEHVFMIPLDALGRAGQQLPVIDFAGGHRPTGAKHVSLGAGITAAPGGVSVLVANAADKAIYYYREGMAAPMGEFQNYGRRPRAVLVVDNSLREVEAGVYSTDVRLDVRGKVDCCFFMDSPRIVHCFEFDVEPAAASERLHQHPLKIQPVVDRRTVPVGQHITLRFQVTDPLSGEPQAGLQDLGVLVNSTRNWQQRQWARHTDDGIYEIGFTAPNSGMYYVSFQCPSRDISFNEIPALTFIGTKEG